MANMFDYIKWRGDLTFAKSAFSPPDALVLSMISYLDLKYCVPPFPNKEIIKITNASKKYYYGAHPTPKYNGIFLKDGLDSILKKVSARERFKNISMSNYSSIHDTSLQMQFSATVFHLPDKSLFVAFRGTDNSLIGWKENFSMSYLSSIPAQKQALKYLTEIASMYKGKILVGGHSKGGNLALFASVNAPRKIRKRIIAVYNFDGPGFDKAFYNTRSYRAVKDKCFTFIPDSSVVGMLFYKGNFTVIKSNKKGIMAHDAFSWNIIQDEFVTVKEISEYSKKINKAITLWLDSMSINERKILVDALFSSSDNQPFQRLYDFRELFFKKYGLILKNTNKLDKESRETLISFFKELNTIKGSFNN